jgi:hypothetical protein
MDPLAGVFLGVIVVGVVAQAVVVAILAVRGRESLRALEARAGRAEAEGRLLSARVEELSARLDELSESAHETAASRARAEAAARRVYWAGEVMQQAVALPFPQIRRGAALIHGVLRAIQAYRQLRHRPAAR